MDRYTILIKHTTGVTITRPLFGTLDTARNAVRTLTLQYPGAVLYLIDDRTGEYKMRAEYSEVL